MCKSTFSHNKECESAADTYAMGTMIFGDSGYSESQRDYCICIPGPRIQSHYRSIVSDFYSKYAPQKTVDVDSLIQNPKYSKQIAESSNSENFDHNYYKLYFELVSKYDRAIAHVESRVGKKIARPKDKREL